MQLRKLIVQPSSEHTISTIEKRATTLKKKVNLPKQEQKRTLFCGKALNSSLKVLFYFYCCRNAVKNDLIPPDLPLSGEFNDNKKELFLGFLKVR